MSLVWFLCLILRQPILKPIGNDGAISKIAETFNNKKFVQSPDGGSLLPVSQASSFFLNKIHVRLDLEFIRIRYLLV